jgi:FlaA1/EpsC-like NDP-sugar epimerase
MWRQHIVMMQIKKYVNEIIFILDQSILIISYLIFLILLPYKTYDNNRYTLKSTIYLIILFVCTLFFQYLLKNNKNVWRYADIKEYMKLTIGVFLGGIISFLISTQFMDIKYTFTITLAVCTLTNLSMLSYRFFYKWLVKTKVFQGSSKIPLGIIGAGSAGVILLEEIHCNPDSCYEVLCFIDDNLEKTGNKIRGINVLGPIDNIAQITESLKIKEVIFAIPSVQVARKNEILKLLANTKLKVKVLPDLLSILQDGGGNYLSAAKELNLDELLGRESVSFDKKEIEEFLRHKTVMVTGGGGSIGSELCRQIASTEPKDIIILDCYENNAYDIQQELLHKLKDKTNLHVEIASVQDKDKMDEIFNKYRPHIVFHAAAHKHVPFMEVNPEEAIKNNVFGTYNVVLAASKWKVKKFVLISTDKAVNPTSIMGASKRMCEMIILSMKGISDTEFVAVRFGNVLGSNGSVIPLFMKQIELGLPITITDKRVCRYFMTIPEASQLVLRAGSMSTNSEIYVLDMGQEIRIITLAENLIKLLGYEPYTQIPIKEIGLRPGEKLNEELLMNEGELIKTANHKIYIEQQEDIKMEDIKKKLEILSNVLTTHDKEKIKEAIREVTPTFKIEDKDI